MREKYERIPGVLNSVRFLLIISVGDEPSPSTGHSQDIKKSRQRTNSYYRRRH